MKERLTKGEINSSELWEYLLGTQPIARLSPGDYSPLHFSSIRLDEQGRIYFNGLRVSIELKSKPQ